LAGGTLQAGAIEREIFATASGTIRHLLVNFCSVQGSHSCIRLVNKLVFPHGSHTKEKLPSVWIVSCMRRQAVRLNV
jgi:hypothetical protein